MRVRNVWRIRCRVCGIVPLYLTPVGGDWCEDLRACDARVGRPWPGDAAKGGR